MNPSDMTFSIPLPAFLTTLSSIFKRNADMIVFVLLGAISVTAFLIYLDNGLGLAYNDARSHLDIGRRVVEGLKPGFAQLGSVWLPLPHLLMVPTIWSDFMWHSGLSGALQSMFSFVGTGLMIVYFLRRIGVSLLGQFVGVAVFVANSNILYLQSTAMTELLLIATMTAGVYELMMWHREEKLLNLVKAAFFIMLSTLIRYDGWLLLFIATLLVAVQALRKRGFKTSEGTAILFVTLGAFGIALWFLWNTIIFKDPFYFAFGPYSAKAQQEQLEQAGVLATKDNLLLSLKIYLYALAYNSGAYTMVLGFISAVVFFFDKRLPGAIRLASSALFAPFLFNIIALYLGHSVLFVQGISGNTWFNVRYGVMMVPSIAIFIGYLVSRVSSLKYIVIGSLILVTAIAFINNDAVTIDDARVGSSQKNVSEVAGWLNQNALERDGFVLISAASHDAIIFSSGLPMSKFIHEGTGKYWNSATSSPDRWARFIIMRTNDNNDQTFKLVNKSGALPKYDLVGHYPFADIYELKSVYMKDLNTKPILWQNNK